MFWRLWLRSLSVRRPQSALALAALALGTTVASLLLNLYGDARRKMQDEFRAYGPNVVLAPVKSGIDGGESAGSFGGLMDAMVFARVETELRALVPTSGTAIAVPILYVVVAARPARSSDSPPSDLVAVGTDFARLKALNPAWKLSGAVSGLASGACALGAHAAARLGVKPGDPLELAFLNDRRAAEAAGPPTVCSVAGLVSSGAGEDDQVFLRLDRLQQMAGLAGSISLVEMRVSGTPAQVERAVGDLRQGVPSIEVRPVREIVQSEGKVLQTIQGLMLALAALILGVVILCVMATVTSIVLERRKEVAVMKALGASDRTLFGLLMAEIGALGLAGGLAGFLLGALLARRLGLDLFGVTLNTAWWTLGPVLVTALLVAAVPALVPVSSVRSIDPARALRGE